MLYTGKCEIPQSESDGKFYSRLKACRPAWLKSSFQQQPKSKRAKNPGTFLNPALELERDSLPFFQQIRQANLSNEREGSCSKQPVSSSKPQKTAGEKAEERKQGFFKEAAGPGWWSGLGKFCRCRETASVQEKHFWISSLKAVPPPAVACALCSLPPSPGTASPFYLLTQSKGGAAEGNNPTPWIWFSELLDSLS